MIVDTNVYLSRWPFRRLRGDEPERLVSLLGERGVGQAWAGSFDGLLHKDIASVNARLAEDCRTHGKGLLVPFGSVNPKLPDWREDLRRCHEDHRMPGIRLHPNYHGYTLADPLAAELVGLAAARGMVVQLAWCMEDERTQHPLLRVPNVDLAPLAGLLRRTQGLRLAILNWRSVLSGQARRLADAGQVYFEFAMLEGPGGVERLLRAVPPERVLFGSYSPFYYFESAALKVRESGLTEEQRQAVEEGNARRLLTRPTAP